MGGGGGGYCSIDLFTFVLVELLRAGDLYFRVCLEAPIPQSITIEFFRDFFLLISMKENS